MHLGPCDSRSTSEIVQTHVKNPSDRFASELKPACEIFKCFVCVLLIKVVITVVVTYTLGQRARVTHVMFPVLPHFSYYSTFTDLFINFN